MRVLYAVVLCALAGSATSSDREELTYLKEVLWPQAYRENDVELLDAILDDSFQMVTAAGPWSDKATELAEVPVSDWPHDDFRFTIKRLDIYHDNTAIVAGEGRAEGTGDTGPYCFTYQSTNVLVRRGERWRAVASHVSGVRQECD